MYGRAISIKYSCLILNTFHVIATNYLKNKESEAISVLCMENNIVYMVYSTHKDVVSWQNSCKRHEHMKN